MKHTHLAKIVLATPFLLLALGFTGLLWAQERKSPELSQPRPGRLPAPVPPPTAVHPADEPDEMQRFYLRKRVGRGTELPLEKYLAAQRHMARMPVFSSRQGRPVAGSAAQGEEQFLAGISTWNPLGPGNVGGRTRTLVIDPAVPATIYAGAASGGVWKSTDSGATWNAVGDMLPNLAVNALVLDLTSPPTDRVLYAGTGEGFLNSDALRGSGIFKSVNSGKTWTRLAATATPDFYYVNDLVISPTNSQVVYAATRTGVWKSSDGGQTWGRTLAATGAGGASATMVNTQSDTGILDLAVRTDTAKDKDTVFASSGTYASDGVYRTTDSGLTWARVLTAPDISRTSLAIAPSAQNTIYAMAARTSNRLLNVFRSTDGGQTWAPRIEGAFSPTRLDFLLLTNPFLASYSICSPNVSGDFISQGWYDNVIAVSPSDPNVVFAGGIDLFRSDDGGASFGICSYWWIDPTEAAYVHADHHVLTFDPRWNGTTNQTLLVGTDGGIFRTTKGMGAVASGYGRGVCFYEPGIPPAIPWASLNHGYGATQFYGGAVFPGGMSLIGGTQDNGVVMGSARQPNAWSTLLTGDGGFCGVDATTDGATYYVSNQTVSLYRTTDRGKTFESAIKGLRDVFLFIVPYALDAQKPNVLWTGGGRPFRTLNQGTSWEPASPTEFPGGPVSAVAIAPTNSDVVYMGTVNGGIFRTVNGLAETPTWGRGQGLPTGAWCSSITVDPKNPLVAYATFSSFGFGHVWKTTDGGLNWANLDGKNSTAIPDIPVNSFAVHPTVPTVLFAGTDLGVFVSIDGGQNWNVENTGFASVAVEHLAWEPTTKPNVFPNPPVLYAFTHGRGVFRTEVSLNPPKPPSPLVANLGELGKINLGWSRNQPEVTGFSLERKTATDQFFEVLTLLPGTQLTYTDTVQPGTRYVYRMRSLTDGGASAYSNEATVRTVGVAPPSQLRAIPVTTTQTRLEWRDNSDNEQGFFIERKEEATGTFRQVGVVGPNAIGFLDQKVQEGLVYFYRVQATSLDGDSTFSNEDSPTPATPTNLKATVASVSEISLSWADNSSNEIAYLVEHKLDNGDYGVLSRLGPDATRFLHRYASPGALHTYRIRAVNSVLSSRPSAEFAVYLDPVPLVPTPPTELQAATVAENRISLQWKDTSDNEAGFKVERRTSDLVDFTLLKTLDANITKFEDTGLVAGTAYVYRVRAVNGGGESSYSNDATAVTKGVAPPMNVTATAVSATEMNVTWRDASYNETGFRIERRLGSAGTFALVGTGTANQTSFLDKGLQPKTGYVYRVRAFNATEESVNSKEALGTTKIPPPAVTSLTPTKGRIGTLVTVMGTDLDGAQVMVSGVSVGLFDATSTRLSFLIPAVPFGNAGIVITTPSGTALTNFQVTRKK
ncbi:MAG: fibronectin type III domain-containing protein [Blastocatellia bacterium]|nr:fibronectin type III domain-containing protein [Blastocatellia bacterium]